MPFLSLVKRSLAALILGLCLAASFGVARAEEFTVSNSAEFQDALNEAASNGQADTINLNAGTYPALSNFFYGPPSTENFALNIKGAGAGSTIITVQGAPPIEFLTFNLASVNSDEFMVVTVDGIGFQDGGAGIGYNGKASTFQLTNCDFSGNFGNAVNAVFGLSGALDIQGNTFSSNGTGLSVVFLSGGDMNLEGNLFEDHTTSATVNLSLGDGELMAVGNTFRNNTRTVSAGGALVVNTNGAVNLQGNLFQDNDAVNSGGAVEASAGSLTVVNNIFLGNRTLGSGQGGALSADYDSLVLTNNTFADNMSQTGGGAADIAPNGGGSTEVYNNIFFANRATSVLGADDLVVYDNFLGAGPPVTVSNNILFDFLDQCSESGGTCTPDLTTSDNNPDDPLFANLAAGDVNLLNGSPAIGAGSASAPALPAVDFNGHAVANPPDLGALAAVTGITVNPLSMNFGNVAVGGSDPQPFTITNNGALPLEVSSLALSDTTNYSLDGSGCGSGPFTLAPGENCDFTVSFAPGSEGTFDATLDVVSNDPENPTVPVALTGIGTAGGGGGGDDGGCGLSRGFARTPWAAWLFALAPLVFGMRRVRRN